MKVLRKSFVAVSMVLFGFMACCATGADAREIKMGHAYAANNPMHKALEIFAAEVAKETGGELTFEVLHSGVLGGEIELIQQTIGGMLEASFIGGVTMFQGFAPATAIEDLPFLFTDRETAHKAYDGEFGKILSEKHIDPLGVKVVGIIEHGFRQVTNSKRSVVKPEDMSGLKLRVPPLELRVQAFKLLGANPVPMALPELFTALQQGTVDGQENPLATIESYKFNEVQKHLSLTNHTYTAGPLIFNRAAWDKFDPETQKIILKAAESAKKASRELYAQYEGEALERLKKSGVQVVEHVDTKAFQDKVQPVLDSYAKKFGSELIGLARNPK